MKNLIVNAQHAGNLNSIKNGHPLANVDDVNGLIDTLFMTQLDSASSDLLNQFQENELLKNPLKDNRTGTQDQPNTDVNSINLIDAMQLAASQALIQSQVPALQNVPNLSLSSASLPQLGPIEQSSELLSVNTRAGIANQNLLNILNGAVPQNLANVSSFASVSSNTTHVQDVNTDILNAQNTSPLAVQNKVDMLPVHEAINVNIQEISSNYYKNQEVKAAPDIKITNLSDALKSIGDVKVLSVDQSISKSKMTQAFTFDSQQIQGVAPLNLANNSSAIDAVIKLAPNQVTKEATTDKKSADEFSGVSTGFMLNPGFTNHVNHEVSLKLDAVNTSLTAGPLHSELISAAKSGGGRISLEVNPDNAGPIRIDLQIDQGGQARLVVQGASESTQARLEQGGDHLREQFAQMGLQLSLDMRQNSANQNFNQQTNDFSNQFSNNQGQQNIASGVNSNRIGTEDLLVRNQQSNAGNSSGINLFA